jgi:DNA-binding XRE family transcriptional regulator
MTFAECIRLRRTELNLTQAAAAALLSVSRRTIQHWEDARRPAPHILTQEGALARLDAEQPRRNVDAVGAPASSV